MPYVLRLRSDSGYYQYKLPGWKTYKTTWTKDKVEAYKIVHEAIEVQKNKKKPATEKQSKILRKYLDPFFDWDRCPHVRQLRDEGKSITRRYVTDKRRHMIRYIFSDPISNERIEDLRRADILDFRSRLLVQTGPALANRVIGILKTVFREGIFREELDRDPTLGIGEIKYEQQVTGTFTQDELREIFPTESLGSWKDLKDFTCFLLAATTGMRRGEILALRWLNIDFLENIIVVDRAWKDDKFTEEGKPKWGQAREVPLPSITAQRLNELREDSIRTAINDLVLCFDDGSPLGRGWWLNHFYRAMERAGIDRKARNLKPHSFRHTWNTLLRRAKIDPARIRKSLGWSQERTQEGYTHWEVEDLREQTDVADGIWGQ